MNNIEILDEKRSKIEKKQARREKQRAANILRAKAMHRLRIEDTDLAPKNIINYPEINIGCSGWFYWDWREKFYPSGVFYFNFHQVFHLLQVD